jgi:TonB family protein
MPRDARFWRNLAIIAIAHLVILLALARAGRDSGNINPPSIVWMNSGGVETVAPSPPANPAQSGPPAPAPPVPQEKEAAAPADTRSEIELPSPTPVATSTPKPRPSVTPSPSPSASPKPTPKPTPKKMVAKATPTPSPRKKVPERKEEADREKKIEAETPAKKHVSSEKAAEKSSEAGNGPGDGSHGTSEFAWYGRMLHDRFRKEWEQPTTIVATGAKMATLVKIRIEKDGRVSKFTIVKPSGNVLVDESVAAVAPKITQVDPLPAGLVKGAYYEVQINFELNPEK